MLEEPMNAIASDVRQSTQSQPKAALLERLALKRQGMIGYVLVFPDRKWTGRVFTSRNRAARQLTRDPGAGLFLVNPVGTLYFEREGRAISRVGAHPMLPESIDIRPASRRRMKRATAARA